jgi:tRNA pseudouridine32 synthase/23S rRNA pseudouridine746 synthase
LIRSTGPDTGLLVEGPNDPTYAYSAWCRHCGTTHRLPRTGDALVAVKSLAAEVGEGGYFAGDGKMLGVLIGDEPSGRTVTLRAFSGALAGRPYAPGFVGPTRNGGFTEDEERQTLAALSALSREIALVDVEAARLELQGVLHPYDARIAGLESIRRTARQERQRQREELGRSPLSCEVEVRLAALDAASRAERQALRHLRRERDEAAAPLRARFDVLEKRRQELRRERRRRSRALQAAMHASHGLVNFAGRYAPLRELFGSRGIPSGAGDCCAPKLLHAAALAGIRPHAMAEIWCGPSPADGSRRDGEVYGPCDEKCAPLLGHLLCGLEKPLPPVSILFEDEDLLVVDKPAGLLSVPGRTSATRDCVESRLALLRPDDPYLRAAHRLDLGTSGVLVIARSATSLGCLTRAFAERRIAKRYEAIVAGTVAECRGVIDLPLRADRRDYPLQVVDRRAGKRAVTEFEVRGRSELGTRLDLFPRTGRTHQLRAHCAAAEGLGTPILGDPLYGDASTAPRLMLHAARLEVAHPSTGRSMVFESPTPF